MGVGVSPKGIKEAIEHLMWSNQAAMQTLAGIPDLIREAIPVQSEPDRLGRDEIHQVHTFVAPMEVNGQLQRARMTIRETNMGRKYYGHRLERLDMKTPGAFRVCLGDSLPPTGTQHPDTIKVGDLIEGFNPHGEKS
jgi:hypothetical protein